MSFVPKELMTSTKFIFIATAILLFGGCQHQIHITNNAFADVYSIPRGFARASSFYFLPVRLNDCCNNKLFAKEIARKAENLLENRGYLIEDRETAAYYVQINGAIREESITVDVATYIPGEAQTTEGSVHSNKGCAHYEERTKKEGKIVYVPEERIQYVKTIDIEVYRARSYKQSKDQEPVWQGSAMTIDEDSDLRETIDYLLISAFNHFGKNTRKKVETSIGSGDKEVEQLRESYY